MTSPQRFLTLFATACALSVMPHAMAQGVGFSYQSETFQGASLPAPLNLELYELERGFNEQRQQVIEKFVINRYLKEEAAAQGKSVEALQADLFKVSKPSLDELREFYAQNKARIPVPFDQAKDQISEYLQNQQLFAKTDAVMQRISADKSYQLILDEPVAPVFNINIKGHPSLGSANAKVTLVEYADYQCPHCKQASAVVKKLHKFYGDKLQIVYKDLPINASGISTAFAEGAVCADQQGKFWDYNALTFDRQEYLSAITPSVLADEMGLDATRFEACLKQGDATAKVAASKAEATSFGARSTPSFYINGHAMPHSHGDLETELKALIDAQM